MSHSQFHCTLAILEHAWLNLWDKHMTTGRINQVSSFKTFDHLANGFSHNHSPICTQWSSSPFLTLRKTFLWSNPTRNSIMFVHKYPSFIQQSPCVGQTIQRPCWHRVRKSHHTWQPCVLGSLLSAPVGTGCGKATATQSHSEARASYPYFWARKPIPTKPKKKRKKSSN